uniref:Splicing factor Cactin n=1 Tax=Steinernema glaseri TaxID=37863 RepID=A0A1I7XX41_9BILA
MDAVERHRAEKREARHAEKRRIKENETEEERRQRRLLKKQRKDEKRRDSDDEPVSSIGYTNMNNPFNDRSLTETFVWKKKHDAEGRKNVSYKAMEKMHREKIARNIDEMQELRRNRAARDAAREDIEMMNREQERSQFSEWQKTERDFEITQAKARTMIRIKENRAKPIDLLYRFVKHSNGAVNDEDDLPPFVVEDPISYIKGCSISDLEDLAADVKAMGSIDSSKNRGYWGDIRSVVEDELRLKQGESGSSLSSVHSSLHADVLKIFKGKSLEELRRLEDQIQTKIRSRDPGTNVSYYEDMLRYLVVYVARMRLKERYSDLLKKKLAQIKAEQSEKMEAVDKDIKKEPGVVTAERKYSIPEEIDDDKAQQIVRDNVELPVTAAQMKAFDDEEREIQWQQLSEEQTVALSLAFYEAGRYSPTYGDESDTMPGIEILDPEEDVRNRRAMQEGAKNAGMSAMTSREAEMISIAKKGMGGDESTFAVEENLGEQSLLWSDKYRPRKPRYFNRVHTGFDWNKYNQTHYDIDNPPPKIVQGYRFNIFYPDLLDPLHTPSFTVTQCSDPDFAIIRFKAGPPYEDIAFKIVNREWEINHKHGYKCQFHNSVFQLWFFFKRYRYRR